MPYIRQSARDEVQRVGALSGGELNYAVTRLLVDFLGLEEGGTISYESLNTAVGALECAKLELYRRVAAPYEDQKKEENGDVYY